MWWLVLLGYLWVGTAFLAAYLTAVFLMGVRMKMSGALLAMFLWPAVVPILFFGTTNERRAYETWSQRLKGQSGGAGLRRE